MRQLRMVRVLASAGVIRPYGPSTLLRVALTTYRWGMGFAAGIGALAIRSPQDTGLVDEIGELSWAQVDERATRLAHGLAELGVREGDRVAVLCRNHRYFVDASTALSRLAADTLYLNTAFSAPQLAEVCERETPAAIIYDEEFTDVVDNAGVGVPRVVAWHAGGADTPGDVPVVEELIENGSSEPHRAPGRTSRAIILTSGTTGAPKGARPGEAKLDAAVALLSKMPLRTGGTTHIAAPLFHTWGWAHLQLAMLLGSRVVLGRRFDPVECLGTIERYDVDALIVIPVMLQRILRLAEDQRSGDYSALRVVASSGSELPGDLATEWMDAFGDNLYNTYGSTEVAWATIAQPQDLREAPGTAGRAPYNTQVRICDVTGNEVAEGESGRIFVGNTMLFGGYTGEQTMSKELVDGLMASGDVGHLDSHGRLFVEGRDDEMVVSGGENVFPREVEDCLARHRNVDAAAVVGVDDEEYGKRLRAFVVANGDVPAGELREILSGHVRDNLARYKVPREIVFLEELPRNPTGKVLKRELESLGAESGTPARSERGGWHDDPHDSVDRRQGP
jgi:fatty-acyl-CoA synthase